MKFILTLLAIDIVIAWIGNVYIIPHDPSAMLILIFVLPMLIFSNIIIGLIYRKTNEKFLGCFLNAIICPAIYIAFADWRSDVYSKNNYKAYGFNVNGQEYELSFNLDKKRFVNGRMFSFCEVHHATEEHRSSTCMHGKYKLSGDTILLLFTYEDRKLYMHNNLLLGFPEPNSTIALNLK